MNVIDLIVCLLLVVAVWNGWRKGFIVQICSLAGIVAAIWLAARYGPAVGGWLRLEGAAAPLGGFVAVLLAVLLLVALLSRGVRRIFRFAGLGVLDIVLGVAVSVLKYLLVLSVAFNLFISLNATYRIVDPAVMTGSYTFRPVARMSRALFPYLEWIGDRVKEVAAPPSETPLQEL